MARRTALAEATGLIERFFVETKDGLMTDIRATRQPPRRAELLSQLDTFDKVEGRYYHWLTSQETVK